MKAFLEISQDEKICALNTLRWRLVVDNGPEIRSRRLYMSVYLAETSAKKWAERFGIEIKRISKPSGVPYYGDG